MKLDAEALTLKALAGLHGEQPTAARELLDESGIAAHDFTSSKTQALFLALAEMIRGGQQLEVLSLAQATAHAVPRELVLEVVAGDNPEIAAERVTALRAEGRRRRTLEHLAGLAGVLRSGGSIDAAMGEVERVLRQVVAEQGSGATFADASLMTVIDKLEAVQQGRREPVLPTGIDALDYVIGGLQSTLTIVGALPGIGKSALFASIARNIAHRGVRVGVLSLEDEREWLTERLLAEASRVPLFVLGTKPLGSEQMQRVGDASEGVHKLLKSVLVEDTPGLNPAEVVAAARSMVARGCKAILVDHLGEIRLDRSQRHDLDIMEVLQDLRAIAKTYRVPVVVACHLKRRPGLELTTVPLLSDFAFSAAIERCARVALGLFRPSKDEMGIALLKQTKGPAGFDFRLNLAKLYGTVEQTAPSSALREEFGDWREK